jgi:hypothetical protein
VDASTDWGIGILLGGKWDVEHGIGVQKSHSHQIGWFERIALELLLYAIEAAAFTTSSCSYTPTPRESLALSTREEAITTR